jgi:hypothetical protein
MLVVFHLLIVNRAVDFNYQPVCWCQEVDDEVSYWALPAELDSVKLLATESLPKKMFTASGFPAKLASTANRPAAKGLV